MTNKIPVYLIGSSEDIRTYKSRYELSKVNQEVWDIAETLKAHNYIVKVILSQEYYQDPFLWWTNAKVLEKKLKKASINYLYSPVDFLNFDRQQEEFKVSDQPGDIRRNPRD